MAYRVAKKSNRTNSLCYSKSSKEAILVLSDNMYDGVIYDRVANSSAYSAKIPHRCVIFSMEEFDKLHIEYDHRGHAFVYEENFEKIIQLAKLKKEWKPLQN